MHVAPKAIVKVDGIGYLRVGRGRGHCANDILWYFGTEFLGEIIRNARFFCDLNCGDSPLVKEMTIQFVSVVCVTFNYSWASL